MVGVVEVVLLLDTNGSVVTYAVLSSTRNGRVQQGIMDGFVLDYVDSVVGSGLATGSI